MDYRSAVAYCFQPDKVEAPLFVIVILLVTSFWQGWSYVNRLKLIIPFIVLFVAWYARVYFILPEVPDLLTKELVIAVISVLVGFGLFTVVSGLKVLDLIVKRTPFLTLIVLVANEHHIYYHKT